MNIEEAKKIVDKLSVDSDELWKIPMIPAHKVKALLDTLDQPKPEVPQMIFDVIKSFDDDVDYLHQHMSRQSDEVREWLTHNEREFYEAWLAYPNITIEKEKLYTVEIPNPNERQLSFVLMRQLSGNVSIKVMHRDNLDLLKTDNDLQLTESEIRKDFDWAWQFREEVVE
ncbi:TPA: DUF1642 domain-containing protein [Streptococcus agalactiae]|uniref:DUF1642 domain-containing protein n=2 Tax=Streptococcus agalactiae TaxID=1311 RepID=UPI0002BAD8EF|nr:DUF1642 domain-containing protein [Streptococcus agalactiae]EMA8744267.1 DUF1642 domain-containing protein [Streptococcus agalactiae]EPT53270.1 hypothetical protein SAG0052_00900 [Streptococcus agalactiae CCUG 24810]EPV06014.1 hypothetical protein SAG0326_07125 [Streptococcus agalactiae GB00543]EPW23608.1 hypothetical protein SAG0062_03270 [Streptococcus agalactiae CCUG 37739]EPW82212.1 hypothetical protein SAG0112_04935 [Streptococcus agalactiae MRI Z1-199]